MSDDWLADVKRYVPHPDETAVAGIVRYCGIALRTRDAALVSFEDPEETGRVREHFLKQKLALTDSDEVLDHEIAAVGQRMGDTHFRNRVTVYYLLAERFGKLGAFHHEIPVAAAAPIAAEPVVAAAPPPPPGPAATPESAARASGKWWLWLLLLLAALLLFLLLRACAAPPASAPAPTPPAIDTAGNTPAPAAASEPEGAAVVATTRADKPALNVYFDTAKTQVASEFDDKAADLKAYAAAHPDAKLSVSGFNDPTGNAAANAELSKHRAQAVADALKALGIPDSAIDLRKPDAATDTGTSNAAARRVEVSFE